MTTLLATPEQRAILADYAGGSIVNLMSTISSSFGARDGPYAALRDPAIGACLRDRGRVVLIVIDGLGADRLARHYNGSTLHRHLHGTLTSVFPSTTATAITTFLTGLAPAQHGLTGWHMYFPDVATVGSVLPLRTRRTDQPLTALG